MNEALSLKHPPFEPIGLSDLLALVGLPSLRLSSSGELSASVEGARKGIASLIDDLLVRSVAAQNKKEFIATREELFGEYAGLITCMARLVRLAVPEIVIERVTQETFCQLESEFRENGIACFGEAAKDQAIFTVWTLRRTSSLISKIGAAPPIGDAIKAQDKDLAEAFNYYTAWAQFHLDCMLAAMRFGKTIQLDVLPEIIDGLRAAVNAYGYSRQGLDLRFPRQEPEIEAFEWDEEDQELLDSSMRDMAVTLDDQAR